MTAEHSRGGEKVFWDPKIRANASIVLPGEHQVTSTADLALATLLGSCVCACIRDSELGLGGMNHFLLPDDRSDAEAGSMRYGVNAMEVLINDILKRGGSRRRLEAKVFGGGNVIGSTAKQTVGDRNCEFVREYLRREGVPIISSDLGGSIARRVYFFPTTGRAAVQRLESAATRSVREAEMRLKASIDQGPKAGSVELFV